MVAPVAVRVMIPLWEPAVREAVAAVTVMVPAPVPEAGFTLNQGTLSLADHVNVPPPVLLMLRVWVAGLPPPCWAVKDRLDGLIAIAGFDGPEEERDGGASS